jgi:hypothetical protein
LVLTDKKDPMDDSRTIGFGVEGHYLSGKPALAFGKPAFMVSCSDKWLGLRSLVYANVKFYSDVDNVTTFEYRIDDAPKRGAVGIISDDHQLLLIDRVRVDAVSQTEEMLKFNDTQPTRKLLVSVPVDQDSNVVVRFDLPDVAEIKAACTQVQKKP